MRVLHVWVEIRHVFPESDSCQEASDGNDIQVAWPSLSSCGAESEQEAKSLGRLQPRFCSVVKSLHIQTQDLYSSLHWSSERGLGNTGPWIPAAPWPHFSVLTVFLNIHCCCLVAKSCPTLLQPHELKPIRFLCSWDFSGKNTAVGCRFLLQGIFPTQESSPCLLHWQANSLPLSHQGSPQYPLDSQKQIIVGSAVSKEQLANCGRE